MIQQAGSYFGFKPLCARQHSTVPIVFPTAQVTPAIIKVKERRTTEQLLISFRHFLLVFVAQAEIFLPRKIPSTTFKLSDKIFSFLINPSTELREVTRKYIVAYKGYLVLQ